MRNQWSWVGQVSVLYHLGGCSQVVLGPPEHSEYLTLCQALAAMPSMPAGQWEHLDSLEKKRYCITLVELDDKDEGESK